MRKCLPLCEFQFGEVLQSFMYCLRVVFYEDCWFAFNWFCWELFFGWNLLCNLFGVFFANVGRLCCDYYCFLGFGVGWIFFVLFNFHSKNNIYWYISITTNYQPDLILWIDNTYLLLILSSASLRAIFSKNKKSIKKCQVV